MYKYCAVILLFFAIHPVAQENNAKAITSKHFKRLYKVSDSVYRSEQPSKKGFTELEAIGVKTILNLRRLKDDNRKAKHTNLVLEHIRLKSKTVDQEDIINALKVIRDAEKPVLIHCWHGSDRTGVITAAYRIIFQDWTKEAAINELRQPEFGYHENWYPNLMELLNDLNIEQIKTELGI
ncbi:tyrosine-protein phosphatase [Winogradskyella sp.]|uniref:tyrosine-protein phosphatase n=1 Tax=Winogradskyella sp. TaxID=1883156 RepID=UPI003BAC5E43